MNCIAGPRRTPISRCSRGARTTPSIASWSTPETGAFSPDTIYTFVDPHIAALPPIRGLDAGSGYGGTCFRCLHVHGGHWTGVTISPEQWTSAKGIAKARGFDSRIDFHLSSYDAPLPGRYNVVVAIESLIHAADPGHTLANLASAIDPGGRLILIDDMPVDPVPARDARVPRRIQALLALPGGAERRRLDRRGRRGRIAAGQPRGSFRA